MSQVKKLYFADLLSKEPVVSLLKLVEICLQKKELVSDDLSNELLAFLEHWETEGELESKCKMYIDKLKSL